MLYRSRTGIETRFVRFTRGQQNFRGFNFREWLLTREKRENKYIAKITNNTVRSKAQRSVVARLRGGTAPLEIETGRYVGIPAEQRICKLCRGAVEDEVHFCITCPALVMPQSHFYSQWTPCFMDHRNLSKSYMLQTKTTRWWISSLTRLRPRTNC